jgi:hypothetical protein
MNTEPVQVLDHGGRKLRPRALRIKVFVAQDQRPLALNSSLRRNPKRPRMADVQQAAGRRREASAIWWGGLAHIGILIIAIE